MLKFIVNYKSVIVNSIFLLGYMGSGKSAIGKSLSIKLNIPFMDIDQLIENQENMSVSSLFKKKGELYFRQIERKLLLRLIDKQSPAVISLGGGTPCYFDNMELLVKSKHESIYLKASIPTLSQRLKEEKSKRPMIAHLEDDQALIEFIGKHLFERNFFYQQAKISFAQDGLSVAEIVEELYATLT